MLLVPVSGKSKEKDRKEPTRQSTLFGLPLGKPIEKPEKRGRKKKVTEDSSQSRDAEGSSKPTTPVPESVPESEPDSFTQASDVTMAEVEVEEPSEATLVETQPLDEAYETQVESQVVQVDTNGACVFFNVYCRCSDRLRTGERDSSGRAKGYECGMTLLSVSKMSMRQFIDFVRRRMRN